MNGPSGMMILTDLVLDGNGFGSYDMKILKDLLLKVCQKLSLKDQIRKNLYTRGAIHVINEV